VLYALRLSVLLNYLVLRLLLPKGDEGVVVDGVVWAGSLCSAVGGWRFRVVLLVHELLRDKWRRLRQPWNVRLPYGSASSDASDADTWRGLFRSAHCSGRCACVYALPI
jgi:hypothetical protein